jgi:hypothetical protein
VVFNWRPDARFSGPGLRHDVLLLPSATSCADVRRRARTAWLVVWRDVLVSQPQLRPSPGERCLRGIRPTYVNQVFAVYAG